MEDEVAQSRVKTMESDVKNSYEFGLILIPKEGIQGKELVSMMIMDLKSRNTGEKL